MPFPASHNQGSPILELENPGRCDLQRKIQKFRTYLNQRTQVLCIEVFESLGSDCLPRVSTRQSDRSQIYVEKGGVNYRREIWKESSSIISETDCSNGCKEMHLQAI